MRISDLRVEITVDDEKANQAWKDLKDTLDRKCEEVREYNGK